MKILNRTQRVWIRRHKTRLMRDGKFAFAGMVCALAITGVASVISSSAPVSCKVTYTDTIIKTVVVTATPSPTPTRVPTKSPAKLPTKSSGNVINSGNASYYSIDGCLGCNANRTMANGERLDDGRLTLAYNHLPMNTVVTITNTNTGAKVQATVTDTGGFERHGKIADLSVATRDALGCGSTCPIAIEL